MCIAVSHDIHLQAKTVLVRVETAKSTAPWGRAHDNNMRTTIVYLSITLLALSIVAPCLSKGSGAHGEPGTSYHGTSSSGHRSSTGEHGTSSSGYRSSTGEHGTSSSGYRSSTGEYSSGGSGDIDGEGTSGGHGSSSGGYGSSGGYTSSSSGGYTSSSSGYSGGGGSCGSSCASIVMVVVFLAVGVSIVWCCLKAMASREEEKKALLPR
ncbi:hypothetical protein PROFUN_11605 [Planoprotostelium fungivorum]|uniref:Uncharacterized protein n=1 Tax=Planoprotostelium fungivorum TaxID=1890364 RepID=A0A2P6N2B6_9EUKA|nr:hypothetical protein PROFUN_11605 [Planoprotostelium fungivorum]